MRREIQRQVCSAYDGRGKGQSEGDFVDHTRNGGYLEVNRSTGYAREITAEEYHSSNLPKFDDGHSVK